MHTLRSAHLIARLALLWFALSLGVAIASPLLSPKAMELVCSGSGAMKLVVKADDGRTEVSSHTLDCSLCANLAAPPPVAQGAAQPTQPLAYALRTIPAARMAALTGAPLPARGPPAAL